MARVFLGLGSNVDPEAHLRMGLAELRERFGELCVSDVYRSKPLGFAGDDFLNLVVGLDSERSPQAISEELEIIHRLAGRQRGGGPFVSRTLDIDLLLFDDLVDTENLNIPRPDVLNYSFVLRPLSEIAPDHPHPVTGRRLSSHWAEFEADSHPLTKVRVIL